MKNMIDNFHRIIEKYKLSRPVPPDIQKRILKSRKSSLISQLRSKSEYNFFTGMNISFNLALRNIGIRVTNKKSSVVLLALSFATAAIIAAGTVSLFDFEVYKPVDDLTGLPVVILTDGDITVNRKGVDLKMVTVKEALKKGDVIITGEKSNFIVQSGNNSIIGLLPNSKAEIINPGENKKFEILLNKGALLCKVGRFQKRNRFIVKTSNSLTEVKGTGFSVSYNHGRSVIALVEGKLKILYLKEKGEKILDENFTAVITDKINIRGITVIESLEIKKILSIPVITNIENTGKDKIIKSSEKYLKNIYRIDKEINDLKAQEFKKIKFLDGKQNELPPLERLRKSGKNITMFFLNDGSRIAGNIVSQDENKLKLDTGDGIISIPKNDIIRRKEIM